MFGAVPYIEMNRNGAFSDDGVPKRNDETGWVNTAIYIPLKDMVSQIRLQGHCRIGFFTKKAPWFDGEVRHYNWTQLKGTVTVDNEKYEAYIADSGNHDADYTKKEGFNSG